MFSVASRMSAVVSRAISFMRAIREMISVLHRGHSAIRTTGMQRGESLSEIAKAANILAGF
jgi:hypothetical protein